MQMRLKLAIVRARKSQRQVAAETQLLTENRLSEIVCDWVQPNAAEKEALARVLNQPVDQLFTEHQADEDRDARQRRRPLRVVAGAVGHRCPACGADIDTPDGFDSETHLVTCAQCAASGRGGAR